MKRIVIAPVLLFAIVFCGCASVDRREGPGMLAIRLTTLLGMEGSEGDARIYVDGRFVGNYEPDATTLALSPGRHVVVVEVPRVYSRLIQSNGSIEMRAFALRGQERIQVLGSDSKQTLVFNAGNLKSREVSDERGH